MNTLAKPSCTSLYLTTVENQSPLQAKSVSFPPSVALMKEVPKKQHKEVVDTLTWEPGNPWVHVPNWCLTFHMGNQVSFEGGARREVEQRKSKFSFKNQFSSVQLLSCVRLFVTPWTAACQASLSITNSRSPPKAMCIKLVMPSSHLILCHPLLLLPPIHPSIRVFSNESTLRMRRPKYWISALTNTSKSSVCL